MVYVRMYLSLQVVCFEGGTATFPDLLICSGRDPDRKENAGREK